MAKLPEYELLINGKKITEFEEWRLKSPTDQNSKAWADKMEKLSTQTLILNPKERQIRVKYYYRRGTKYFFRNEKDRISFEISRKSKMNKTLMSEMKRGEIYYLVIQLD